MFNDFYGTYKNARNGSWQFLIDNKISEIPLNLKKITDNMQIKVRMDTKMILKPNQRGATMTDNNTTYIIVRNGSTQAEARYTIAHELGHIYLGHPMVNDKYARTFTIEDTYEYQAERFAIDILAPACVLWGLDLHTLQQIAEVCNISMTSATKRARRMEELYRRNMFLSHPLEREVYQQFKNFIEKNKSNNIKI